MCELTMAKVVVIHQWTVFLALLLGIDGRMMAEEQADPREMTKWSELVMLQREVQGWPDRKSCEKLGFPSVRAEGFPEQMWRLSAGEVVMVPMGPSILPVVMSMKMVQEQRGMFVLVLSSEWARFG
jgi:hypothetical protein